MQQTFRNVLEDFYVDKLSIGVRKKTIESYRSRFLVIFKHLQPDTIVTDITKYDIKRVIMEFASLPLSRNTVRSYSAALKAFFMWCDQENICHVEVNLFKGEEVVQETYTKRELLKLLEPPVLRDCTFNEYKCWVIVNLLVNNGCRASSIRNIKCNDVRFDENIIMLRHMKSNNPIAIPMSVSLKEILKQYMYIRKGNEDDYLFPDNEWHQMTESTLRKSINYYNHSRGVRRTGLHKFRHTFARMYLVDCQGDALKLQRLLGHTTLDMTKHYVQIFANDLVNDYKTRSPLEKLKGAD